MIALKIGFGVIYKIKLLVKKIISFRKTKIVIEEMPNKYELKVRVLILLSDP